MTEGMEIISATRDKCLINFTISGLQRAYLYAGGSRHSAPAVTGGRVAMVSVNRLSLLGSAKHQSHFRD